MGIVLQLEAADATGTIKAAAQTNPRILGEVLKWKFDSQRVSETRRTWGQVRISVQIP